MAPNASATGVPGTAVDPDLIYFNGIEPDMGTYAVAPISIDNREAGARPPRGLSGERPARGDPTVRILNGPGASN
jgi:hypothetical protein